MSIEAVLQLCYVWGFLMALSGLIFFLGLRFTEAKDEFGNENPILTAGRNTLMVQVLLAIPVILMILLIIHLGGSIMFFTILTVFEVALLLYRLQVIKYLGGYTKINLLVCVVASAVIGSAWSVFPSWVTHNTIFILICANALAYMKLRFKYVVIILLGMIVFDILGVLVFKFILEIAEKKTLYLPLLAQVPVSPFNWDSEPIAILGSGDILIAGLAMRIAAEYKLVRITTVGYGIGLMGAFLLGVIFNIGIPALVTISPCVLICLLGGYAYKYRKGELTIPLKEAVFHAELSS